MQRVHGVPVAGVVAAVEGDRADPVGALGEDPQHVGQEYRAAGQGAFAQVVQDGGEHGLLVVVHGPAAHDGDEGGDHVQYPAVGLRLQHLAGLAADLAAASPMAPGSRTLMPPRPRPMEMTWPPSARTVSA